MQDHIQYALRESTWARLDAWVASRRTDHQRRAREVRWAVSSIEFEQVLTSATNSLDWLSHHGFEGLEGTLEPVSPIHIDAALEIDRVRQGLPRQGDSVSVPALVWRDLDLVGRLERQLATDRANLPPILWPLPWTELGPDLVAWMRQLLSPALATELGHPLDLYSPDENELRPHELIELAVEICVGPLELSFGPGPFSSFPAATPIIDQSGVESGFHHRGLGFTLPTDALRYAETASLRPELEHRVSEWNSVRTQWRQNVRRASADEVIIYRARGHRVESLPSDALGVDVFFPLG